MPGMSNDRQFQAQPKTTISWINVIGVTLQSKSL